MATNSVTITEFVDDLDGGKADRTIAFTFDGVNFEIDLSKKNATAFEKALKPYLQAARKVRRSPSRTTTRTTSRRRSKRTGPDLAAVRDWARANGHTISDRGRIPTAVLEAYSSAQ